MASLAAAMLRRPVEFEISIHNVDKQPLSVSEIRTRLVQFETRDVVWLTRADTFVKKTGLFPQATFVVGVDTIQRVPDVAYYQGNRGDRDQAIEQLVGQGCRFLVFGRESEGTFIELNDCALPARLAQVCQGVSQASFRRDVSSRALRKGRP